MTLPAFDKPLDSPDIPDNDFDPMPEGEYLGFVKVAKETKSAGGAPMLELHLELAGNPEYNGRQVRYYLVYGNDYTLSNAKKLAKAFNKDITGLKQFKAQDFDGLPCKFKTKVTETTKHNSETGETKIYKNDAFHYWCSLSDDDALAASTQPANGEIDLGDEIPF